MAVVQQVDRQAPRDARGPSTDDAGLAALVVQHQAMIWRYLRLLGASAHESDDLMQDTFVLAAERQRSGETFREPAAYLRTVARNLLIGARRRLRRRPLDEQWIEAVDEFLLAQPEVLEDQRLELLRECIGRLQGRMREAVEQHHVAGDSCRDVARRMGIGANGLKSLLSRARQALRDCVQNKMSEGSSS